jgi:hypothetical protein
MTPYQWMVAACGRGCGAEVPQTDQDQGRKDERFAGEPGNVRKSDLAEQRVQKTDVRIQDPEP